MILHILVFDAIRDEGCQNLIDEYHDAGLINNCLSVDISDPQNWRACFPDEEYGDLVTCLGAGLWTQIVLVSVRRELSESYPSSSRVSAEMKLREYLESKYPKLTSLQCMTLSQIGTSIHESMFPANFQAHYLHQREIDVDPRLPRVDVSENNIEQVLVFTSLTISGAGKWVTEPTWYLVDDFSMGTDRVVRFAKVQTRIGVCGPLVANLAKAVVRPGGGAIPAGLPPGLFTAVNEENNELQKLSNSFIQKYGFHVRPRKLSEEEVSDVVGPMGPIKAMLLFFRGFGRYLRSAVVSEWQDRVDKLARPLLSKLQDITFGDDSTIIIKGVRHEISSDALAAFAEELRSRLDGLDGVTAPKQTPEVWTGLLRTSFALLDGSEYPDATAESPDRIYEPMSSGKRIVFMQPSVVGPDLTDDLFVLTTTDCKTLELDESRARSVSMFEHHEVNRLCSDVKEAVSRVKFRADVEALARDRSKLETEASAAPKSRLRGTLSRTARLEAVKAETSKEETETVTHRTAEQIGADLENWIAKRELLSRDSFIAHLFESLDNAIEHEVSALRWDALIKEIDELIKPIEAPKFRFRRILKIFGLILLPLVLAAVLFSSVLGAVTAVLGIPILVFVLVCWGTSFGFALVVAVFKRALALRGLEFKKRSQASEIEKKYRELVHSINEFRRLQLLKVQFSDWQRLAREIAHYPYGRIEEMGETAEVIDQAAIPPQLVVARLDPDASQATKLRNDAKEQLKVSGYLDSILVEMRNDWQEHYESIGELKLLQPNPEMDVSPSHLEPGVVHGGRKYFFARRDFVESSINGGLRSKLHAKKVRALSQNIFSRSISDVFASVNSGLNKAFVSDSPLDFLAGLSRQNRTAFSTAYFNPEKLSNDGIEEIDLDSSFLTTDDSQVKSFVVSGDDHQILLASTRVDISFPFSPDRLDMYQMKSESDAPVGLISPDDPPV